ncbi:MAG: ankyrin repeat domain-containing protein [Proteobacteria bacterium]|nr:ankyrin repeat domain-containing protein [Pseudomonadota bacterium]
MNARRVCRVGLFLAYLLMIPGSILAQTAPSQIEESAYSDLHAAASKGDADQIRRLIVQGAKVEARDRAGRTPLHVAAFKSHEEAVEALAKAGADMNAFENDSYDVITIAAVANDVEMMRLAISLGGNPRNITSPYDGTALIAAAHLGHFDIVRTLIKAGAPLNHINNLGWTALIEAVVLGDGGPRHVNTARALIKAGADVTISDRQGVTPLAHAKQRGYKDIVALFQKPLK